MRTPPINRNPFASNKPCVAPPEPHADDTLLTRARELRRTATPAECVLWGQLRQLKKHGYHFSRRARVSPFIADFACKSARLIVELDGSQHGEVEHASYDDMRTARLNARGYRVLRFWNREVLDERDRVTSVIVRALSPTRPASRSDLPSMGR